MLEKLDEFVVLHILCGHNNVLYIRAVLNTHTINWRSYIMLTVTDRHCNNRNLVQGWGTQFPPLFLPCPFTSLSFGFYYFFPFSLSHSIYLFSFIVHPIPFYQNRPTPFPGVRS